MRRYLTECLDSVLCQAGPDVEVIAVDDASPDGSGEVLDERARHDSRLKVLHLDARLGPGNARNAGLAKATGRYIWFVDGDDMIMAGALDAVRAMIDKLGAEPDVLLIDYLDLLPDGRSAPSPGADLVRSVPDGEFTLAERPQVINLTMTAWSKLFRRQFLLDLDQPFRPGIHEDIPVTCAALLTGTLSAIGSPCYLYRRSRPGSFMVTSTTDHLAVFTAYGEVFDMLDQLVAAGDPVATAAVQSAVFERAIWHYAAVLQTTAPGIGRFGGAGLVPRSERRRFFERMHADFVRYAPAGYQLPGGARGAKLRLIKRGSYLTYELAEPVNRLRVAIRGRRRS